MAVNNYNPNTGAKLTPGQTVQIGNSGKYVTQGKTGSSSLPTYDKSGGFTTASGKYIPGTSQAAINSRNINKYNPNTGQLLKPGETVQVGNSGFYVKQGEAFNPNMRYPQDRNIQAEDLRNPVNQVQFPQVDETGNLSFYNAINTGLNQQVQNLGEKNALETTQGDELKRFQDYMSTYLQLEQPNSEKLYKEAQRQTDILAKQQAVSDLTGKLNQITAQGQANQMSVVGQGRGIPEAIIGGQQAQIARETAIQALPVSAQLNAAQGNLEMAQQNLETLFKIKSDDAKAKYERNTGILKAFYDFGTAQEKNKFDYLQKQEDRKYNEQQANLSAINNIAIEVAKNGGGNILTKLTDIDYNSPTAIRDAIKIASPNLSSSNKELKEFNGGLYSYDKNTNKLTLLTSGANGTNNDKLYSGLNSTQATAVRSLATKFSSEPIVTGFSTIQEGRNFANSLSNDTKNPADDQGLIYALAKALDPNSVVREGEYATAQKYSQSWIKAYGKGIEQALAGTGFLSNEARKNIKKTIESKYNASKQSYANLKKSYSNGINKIIGQENGKDYLREYEIGATEEIPKGTMDDRTYVEKVLTTNGIKYDEFINSIPKDQIPVIDNTTGEVGTIPIIEWLSNQLTFSKKYTKI